MSNPPIGAIICGDCESTMRILTTVTVHCFNCGVKWQLIKGKWSLLEGYRQKNRRLTE